MASIAVPLVVLAIVAAGCQARTMQSASAQRVSHVPGATSRALGELWIEPEPGRDLFHGVGGPRLRPSPAATYTVIKIKKGGFSEGYTVLDPQRREWSVKLYPEARTEVVASRILWGVGYHQPPIYALEEWWAEGARSENPQPVARFREERPDFHGLTELQPWSYSDNPFLGSRPLAGLLALQVLLGNSDLKPANNMVYTLRERVEGTRRWFVARDLGQTFGRTGILGALRDDVDAFDRTRFVTDVVDGRVKFEYHGRHKSLLENATPADVRWICGRLSRLTDQQWSDAFRAGGYAGPTAQRYIRRLKLKIAEGLALEG
jgi:hypothetical protein